MRLACEPMAYKAQLERAGLFGSGSGSGLSFKKFSGPYAKFFNLHSLLRSFMHFQVVWEFKFWTQVGLQNKCRVRACIFGFGPYNWARFQLCYKGYLVLL